MAWFYEVRNGNRGINREIEKTTDMNDQILRILWLRREHGIEISEFKKMFPSQDIGEGMLETRIHLTNRGVDVAAADPKLIRHVIARSRGKERKRLTD